MLCVLGLVLTCGCRSGGSLQPDVSMAGGGMAGLGLPPWLRIFCFTVKMPQTFNPNSLCGGHCCPCGTRQGGPRGTGSPARSGGVPEPPPFPPVQPAEDRAAGDGERPDHPPALRGPHHPGVRPPGLPTPVLHVGAHEGGSPPVPPCPPWVAQGHGRASPGVSPRRRCCSVPTSSSTWFTSTMVRRRRTMRPAGR